MEHLNPKSITCTEPINIPEYFKTFSTDLKTLEKSVSTCEFSPELDNTCSLKKLKHDDEIDQFVRKSSLFNTMEIHSNATPNHLQIHRIKKKWRPFREPKQAISYPPKPDEDEELDEEEQDLEAHVDVLLIVRLYRPFPSKCASIRNNAKYTHEIAILANQNLTELRDQFKCVLDVGLSEELQHPDDEPNAASKDEYSSGCLFIENCFYNDMRHPNAMEYSSEIVAWAKQKNLGPFTIDYMEDQYLEELKLRLGYPYLYLHHGNCEHLVVFTDMRLLRPDDLLSSSKYPYVLSYNKFNRAFCRMCRRRLAKFMITGSDRLFEPFNLFCKRCVLAYHYRDGTRIGTFKLYPFYDINLILGSTDSDS